MGNGVSRTYPVGIIKHSPTRVSFGKPEVRVYNREEWETKPLLNTHEVRRIEAKIKAAAVRPIEPQCRLPEIELPKPKWWQKLLRTSLEDQLGLLLGSCLVAGAATIFMGPVSFVLPAAVIGFMLVSAAYKATAKKLPTEAEIMARRKAAQHLIKLANKYRRAGLHIEAKLYADMAQKQLRIK